MVNEKFRERVSAWDCFQGKKKFIQFKSTFIGYFYWLLNYFLAERSENFASFFHSCLRLLLSEQKKLSLQEETILIKFLDNCVNSLETDLVRTQVQRICGLPMWVSLSENRRDYEFKKFSKLKKFWKAIEKNDAKLSESEKEKLHFERRFLKNLISKFLSYLDSFDSSRYESGELADQSDKKFKMHFLERCLELLIDLESLLPTRRFFNIFLEDSNLLVHCHMSHLHLNGCEGVDNRLFNQLMQTLKFYTTFEIDDQTGEAKTEAECQELHYEKLKSLQKGVFKYFREDLLAFSLTNIATIDKRETLVKHLGDLSEERLYALAEYLHLVPKKEENANNMESSDQIKSQNFSKNLLLGKLKRI
jgi:intron-binding protein aquarius